MVSQFPSPRILGTAIAQPIAFSCHRFLTYSTNEKLFGELKAQWVKTIFPQNKLCNAWLFRFNYSFFHYNFSIFHSHSLSYSLSMGSLYVYVPRCARDKWTTRMCIFQTTMVLSFFLSWLFSPVATPRWLGVYECRQLYPYHHLSTKGKSVE